LHFFPKKLLWFIYFFSAHTIPMKNKRKLWLIGLAVGFTNGIFGAGGGSILVPALEKFIKFETHKAHATALAVILPLSVVSALVYTWGVDVDWRAALFVSAGGVVGGVLGAKVLKKLSGAWLNMLFGAFLAVGAVRMLFA